MTFKKGDYVYVGNIFDSGIPDEYRSVILNNDYLPYKLNDNRINQIARVNGVYSKGREIEFRIITHNGDSLRSTNSSRSLPVYKGDDYRWGGDYGLIDNIRYLPLEDIAAVKISKRNLSWKAFKKLTRQSD